MLRRSLPVLLCLGLLGACGDTVGETTVPALLPDAGSATFVEVVDNPYWPLAPGSRWVYEGEDDGEFERIEVTVEAERHPVMGVLAVIVRDVVSLEGGVVEDTFDWYVQDSDGNVWYMGEDSKEIEDGVVVSTEGSWEAGVDGAIPGIVMWTEPVAHAGDAYYQEFYEGEAEDQAEVVRVDASLTVAAGSFEDVLVVREWNPLEPGVTELKYYAPGVGLVLEEKETGGESRIELISYQIPG